MDTAHLRTVQEVRDGLLSLSDLTAATSRGTAVVLRGARRSVALGTGMTVKVNTLLGCSVATRIGLEVEKVSQLCSVSYAPDTMMDLSIVRPTKPLYESMIDQFGGPVGTLPHYLCYQSGRIDEHLLIEEIHRQAEAGVAWMTLHLTVRRELFEKASRLRRSPTTARGGALVIRDMYQRGESEGILTKLFSDIMPILRRHRIALSVGTVFRPANIFEALDEIHVEETDLQGEYIAAAREAGVGVILEGVGHIPLDRIPEYIQISKARYNVPFMPLGPMVTNVSVGADHITNAIGSTYMALLGGADAINSVTRQEHTGGVPSLDAVMEGLQAARIAAHSVNITRFAQLRALDFEVVRRRLEYETCVVPGGLFESSAGAAAPGCSRCASQCPLRIGPDIVRSFEGRSRA